MTRPDNPFVATDVGARYDAGRPFHHPRSLAHIRMLVGREPIAHALDVACGTGMSSVALSAHASHVIGVDVSPEMLRAARPDPRVSYMYAAAERLPIADAAVDAVTCCSGVHWFDQPRFFAELRRVLRPKGWVALYDHYFIGEMVDVPAFGAWVAAAFERFPLPARNFQAGDPRAQTPDGFESIADDFFEDDIEMTLDAFVDYQLTISNFVAALDAGTPEPDVRAWLEQSLASLFGDRPRVVRFLGSVNCYRRLP